MEKLVEEWKEVFCLVTFMFMGVIFLGNADTGFGLT